MRRRPDGRREAEARGRVGRGWSWRSPIRDLEDRGLDGVGVQERVAKGITAADGVAEDGPAFDAELLSERLEVGDEVVDGEGGVVGQRVGVERAPLIDANEAQLTGEQADGGHEVGAPLTGPTVHEQNSRRITRPPLVDAQRCATNANKPTRWR